MSYKQITVDGERKLEHRHVMEQLLGRTLESEEQVHHKDRNKRNNSPDNLELCPDAQSHADEHSYSEEELIDFLIQWNHEYIGFPTWKQCAEHIAMPHPSTFARKFGGWREAKKRAQFELDMINEEWY